MIFNGRVYAERLRDVLKKERLVLGDVSLGIVVSRNDQVTNSFVRIKEKNADALGVRLVRYVVGEGANTGAVVEMVQTASHESGIIVQLPFRQNIDVETVIASIPPEKDVDALSPYRVERFRSGDLSVIPPVAGAVRNIIQAEDIAVAGKRAVIVGKGRLVGEPCAELFKQLGASVQVIEKQSTMTILQEADIVVLGAGSPYMLKPEMVKEGVVIFDAGTSETGGVVVGDADPACAEKASFFTPVPGGIGPVAVVQIFQNLFILARH